MTGSTRTKTGVTMSDISGVKALVFDVFGTCVDWRTSLINDSTKWSEASGIKADWTALADVFVHYKPAPETYPVGVNLLRPATEQLIMLGVANNDRKAVQKLRLMTEFIPRPAKDGPHHKYGVEARGNWCLVAKDFVGMEN